jgi:hypothetical protein
MRRPLIHKKAALRLVYLVLAGLLIGIGIRSLFLPAYGAQLGTRSLTLTDSTAASVSTYNFSFNISTPDTLGSVLIQFCSNDPIVGDVCTAPAGFDDSAATIDSQSGQTGFSIDSSSTSNNLVLTRTAAPDTVGTVNIVFANVTNPSSPGSYYARIQTYETTDASGNSSDYGGIAFAITSALSITATVPPYLLFCTGISIPDDNCTNAAGDFIDFGELSPSSAGRGTSQMLAATNAESGYDISVYGTTLQSGINTINGITTPDVSRPGTAQFGMNLRANSSPAGGLDPGGAGTGSPAPNYNQPNFYTFNSGDIVASNPGPDQDRLYTDSYIVNVPVTQAPGVYDSTLTYICVATF